MQEIVSRYNVSESPYLLPIIVRPGMDERKQYINASPSYQQIFEGHWERVGLVRSPDPLRRAPFSGQRSPE